MQGKLRPQRPLRAAITVLQPETQVERVGSGPFIPYSTVIKPSNSRLAGCGKCHLQFGTRAGGGSQVFQFHIPQGQVYPHAAGGQYLHIGGGFGGKVQVIWQRTVQPMGLTAQNSCQLGSQPGFASGGLYWQRYHKTAWRIPRPH